MSMPRADRPAIVPLLVIPPEKVEIELRLIPVPAAIVPELAIPPAKFAMPHAQPPTAMPTLLKADTVTVPLLLMPPGNIETAATTIPWCEAAIVPPLLMPPPKVETPHTAQA